MRRPRPPVPAPKPPAPAPAFLPGARVRVADRWPELHGPAHVRTPHYLRGRSGTIVRVLGVFANPEQLAFRRPAEPHALYHVAFPPIWPEEPQAAPDELLVELYEHWLEPDDAMV